MGTATEPIAAGGPGLSPAEKRVVLDELNRILISPFFRNSTRSKEFLSYVVHEKLEGHEQLLKERTIGTQLFHRKADYETGEDPVVRVHAGEVRRRLERYYHSASAASAVRLDLPVGSYAPEFCWNSVNPNPSPEKVIPQKGPRRLMVIVAVVAVAALAVGAITSLRNSPATKSRSALDQFWSPIFATSQPVLICVAKPILYRPSIDLYRSYSRAHPGTFQTEVDRWNNPLLLDPNEKVPWRDIVRYTDYGVAMGDVYAATQLSALLARMNKPSQVRIGNNYSFEDLRNSPAVVIGAFNNHWTLQMTSNLRYVFVEHEGSFDIEQPGHPGTQSWVINSDGEIVKDYALVTRLLDSTTGQVLIAAAGIGGNGTQAGGEFVSRRDYLDRAFKDAPADWPQKNIQVLLETTITNSVAGPPRVVAKYFW